MKNTRLANVTYSFNLLFTSHFVRKKWKKNKFSPYIFGFYINNE